jgi:5,10-methylene-tetrahydrofolate dehydrogenase/methenyl tetrahydrofolate cyclohydrolase
MQQGGEVTSFNIHADQEFLKKTCLEADIIMCATPQAGLVGGDWVRDDKTQIVIDI